MKRKKGAPILSTAWGYELVRIAGSLAEAIRLQAYGDGDQATRAEEVQKWLLALRKHVDGVRASQPPGPAPEDGYPDQTVLHDERNVGNCLQATIAGVLGWPLMAVPHFALLGEDHWWDCAQAWLEQPRELMEAFLATAQEATFHGFDNSVLKEVFAGPHRRLLETLYRMGFEAGWRIREQQIADGMAPTVGGKHGEDA